MDTNRISKKLNEILNDQVTKEANAAQIYLSYGAWAETQGYAGTADFLFRHAHEERNHMMKVLKYILARGSKPKITALAVPPKDPNNLEECFEKIFKHEVDNTTSIYKIATVALEEKDYATWNFAQWFVREQIEEETMVMDLLDTLRIAGGSNASHEALQYFDAKMGQKNDEAALPREATSQNP
jgi:ferritin